MSRVVKSKLSNELKTEYLIAQRIVYSLNIFNEQLLLSDSPNIATLGCNDICVLKPGSVVVLDFGEEICGGIEITTSASESESSQLRIVFGESVSEAMSDIGYKNATNDHSLRDTIVTALNYSNMRVGSTGFRFVKIECVDGNCHVSGIRAASEYRDIEYKGSFECDDELLNEIWRIGARTVHLNMQNYLLDGIKRDRLVWVGDMHPEVSAIMSVFGYDDIVDKSLQLIRDTTPSNEWMNTLPSYSLWWLIIHYDWYLYTGNRQILLNNKDYIVEVTRHILEVIHDDGTDSFSASTENRDASNPYLKYFIDWGTIGKADSKTGFYSIVIMSLNAAYELLRILDEDSLAQLCSNKIETIKTFALPETSDRQCASLGVLAGILDASDVNSSVLCKEPVADITSFLGYYVLLAKGMANDVTGALDIIRKYWGRMIELGATSFWEFFDYPSSFDAAPIDEFVSDGKKDIHADFGTECYEGLRCSLCHGWACGPTPFISRYVLGVEILEPGCMKLRIKPQLGNLKWIRGTYPTPYGIVKIYAEYSDGKIKVDIEHPDEILIEE